MEYYVISPNVWNDGNFDQLLEDMYAEKMVLMGWSDDCTKGAQFANMKKGDCVIVARRWKNKWNYYFMGIIKSNETYKYKKAQRKNLDTFIDLKKIKNDFLSKWSTAGSSQIPAIGRIIKNRNEKIIQEIDNLIMEKKRMEYINNLKELLENNKNVILHGAPGTGKTHLAKEIAKAMGCSDNEIGFVQFHPSYDYTDFVEGLRPFEGENGEVGFERKDGVFKEFCEKALKKSSSAEEANFDDCWDSLIDYVRENLAQGKLTKIGSWDYGLSSKESLKFSSKNTPSQYTFTITKQNVYDAYQGRKSRPSGEFQNEMNQIVDFMEDKFKLISFDKTIKNEIENKPYVFIIDEINRGELSKIFGELFFSIDPGYRGTKGKVRTQYANMVNGKNEFDIELNSYDSGNFFVPENIYVIGTMNDIDRSVESMDFAMRRRFIFEEVTAEESAENMKLSTDEKERMQRINDVIAKTEGLNDAYKIGGAYFLGVTDFDKLWKIKLSSLIKEYLRGIDDNGSKYKMIEDAYSNRNANNQNTNDTGNNNATVEQ